MNLLNAIGQGIAQTGLNYANHTIEEQSFKKRQDYLEKLKTKSFDHQEGVRNKNSIAAASLANDRYVAAASLASDRSIAAADLANTRAVTAASLASDRSIAAADLANERAIAAADLANERAIELNKTDWQHKTDKEKRTRQHKIEDEKRNMFPNIPRDRIKNITGKDYMRLKSLDTYIKNIEDRIKSLKSTTASGDILSSGSAAEISKLRDKIRDLTLLRSADAASAAYPEDIELLDAYKKMHERVFPSKKANPVTEGSKEKFSGASKAASDGDFGVRLADRNEGPVSPLINPSAAAVVVPQVESNPERDTPQAKGKTAKSFFDPIVENIPFNPATPKGAEKPRSITQNEFVSVGQGIAFKYQKRLRKTSDPKVKASIKNAYLADLTKQIDRLYPNVSGSDRTNWRNFYTARLNDNLEFIPDKHVKKDTRYKFRITLPSSVKENLLSQGFSPAKLNRGSANKSPLVPPNKTNSAEKETLDAMMSMLIRDEGVKLTPYKVGGKGNDTAGVGSELKYLTEEQIKKVKTKKGAEEVARQRGLTNYNLFDSRNAAIFSALDPVRKAVLLSLAYHAGRSGSLRMKTADGKNLLSALKDKNMTYDKFAGLLLKTNYAKKFPNRAKRLAAVFQTGDLKAGGYKK